MRIGKRRPHGSRAKTVLASMSIPSTGEAGPPKPPIIMESSMVAWIPLMVKRGLLAFPKDSKQLDPEVRRKCIYGRHVAAYMSVSIWLPHLIYWIDFRLVSWVSELNTVYDLSYTLMEMNRRSTSLTSVST
ncbi:hypothetical protein MLD38_017675 [Melastoma candidum]|uniref:Uncharacterized protein n=1 Tax=Melastoma candidum TaxID=119954 RepID=A0ACB9QUH0_9MYRT|nr:hypothetical protein MLD38_017675 [Melastoma candidum]